MLGRGPSCVAILSLSINEEEPFILAPAPLCPGLRVQPGG